MPFRTCCQPYRVSLLPRASSSGLFGLHIVEPGAAPLEAQLGLTYRSVAVLGYYDIGNAPGIGLFAQVVVAAPFLRRDEVLFPVYEHHHVGILFDAAALAQVRELRTMRASAHEGAAQLR